jgi:predicted Zn-dependent protease/Flp pilus assembly protein TadD
MMRRTIAVAASFAALLAAADAQPKTPEVAQPVKPSSADRKAAKKAMDVARHEWTAQYDAVHLHDLAGAAKEERAILAMDPDNERAALALASIYFSDKKEKDAVEVLTKLTKKNPKSKDAWMTLAEVAARANDDPGMKAAAAQVIALDPYNMSAYSMLYRGAYQRFKNGDAAARSEALEAARKLVQLGRGQSGAESARTLERAMVELGGQPIDLTIYDAKQSYAAAFNAGMFASINLQIATARAGFESCTRMAPANEECHYYLGLIHSSVAASDAYDLKAAQAELALAPSMAVAWVARAKIFRATEKNAEARAALDEALTRDPLMAVARLELGILDKLDGKTDAAVLNFVRAIDADRFGATGERALTELAKANPTHPYVTQGILNGNAGDVFSTEQYKSLVDYIEQSMGGVEAKAPEQAVLEDIVRRLADGSGVKQQFQVKLVATRMPNAFALADGRVYVTRGLLDTIGKTLPPGKQIDVNNDLLGHVLAHELNHVIHKHTMHTAVFQQAIKDSSTMLDPSVLTHVTRLHEIEADREGMVMAFLAGYHPRGGIEFMELMGKQGEVPKHLDHPTFQERIDYLTDYWTNDVRYAFVSFKLGVAEMDKGAGLEETDLPSAVTAYETAVDHFKRFHTMMPSLKEAMNDLGVAYTKLGVLAMDRNDSPLGRWQTRFSLERESSVKYANLVRDEGTTTHTRGIDKGRLPSQLRDAIASFKEALAVDEDYNRARLNLAAAYLAANQIDSATAMLAKLAPKPDVTSGDVDLIRGIALAESKQYDGARAAFQRAEGFPGLKRAASFNAARALELGGKKAEAKKAYLQYAVVFPGGPWAKAADAAAGKL